jgi:predicted aspartyl protease
LRFLDDPSGKMEVVVTSPKQIQNKSILKLRGKISPFYILIENHDVVLHYCLVDTGATNNIMPLAVMEALGMNCTKYYETSESIYAIDSRQVLDYGEIKDFYTWITTTPHIVTVFNIIVVDLPPAYGVVLGRDWLSMIEG